jgi:hypothetical protein
MTIELNGVNQNFPIVPMSGELGEESAPYVPMQVPRDLRCEIFSKMTPVDIKNMTTVCKDFAATVPNGLIDFLYLSNQLEGKTTLTYAEIEGYQERFRTRFPGQELPFERIFARCPRLERLNLSVSPIDQATLTDLLGSAKASGCTLRHLDISSCTNLRGPISLSDCDDLESLNAKYCTGLTAITLPPRLRDINVSHCGFRGGFTINLDQATTLNMSFCKFLTALSLRAPKLQVLNMETCGIVGALDVGGCEQLTTIDVSSCESMTALHNLSRLKDLVSLSMTDCQGFVGPFDLAGLRSLSDLDIRRCKRITALCNLSHLRSQRPTLRIWDCEGLAGADLSGLSSEAVIIRDLIAGVLGSFDRGGIEGGGAELCFWG